VPCLVSRDRSGRSCRGDGEGSHEGSRREIDEGSRKVICDGSMNEIHHAVIAVVWIDPAKAIPDDTTKTRGG